jgi:hypothetical protein
MVREAKQACAPSIPPFEVGRRLVELERKHHRSARPILRKEVNIKGRRWGKLNSFMKLYHAYRHFPADEMNRLEDAVAVQLADSIVSGVKVIHGGRRIMDDECNMDRRAALNLALNSSAENLRILIRNQCTNVPAFRDERGIESWFERARGDFARKHNLRPLAPQVAFGKALGAVDHVFYGDALGVLVLVELKDSVHFQDVGQALGFRNELVENSQERTDSKMKTAVLYLASKNHPDRFSSSQAKHVDYCSVDVWLVGQVFDPSAYYAAKGQALSFFKITADKQIEGPVRAAHMTLDEWCAFAYGRRPNEPCGRQSRSGELDLTAGRIEL